MYWVLWERFRELRVIIRKRIVAETGQQRESEVVYEALKMFSFGIAKIQNYQNLRIICQAPWSIVCGG